MVEAPGFTEASVLDLVNELHAANPKKATFTLAEIAEAMAPGQVATVKADTSIAIIWIESLNNILKKLGLDKRLTVITEQDENGVECAVVTFPGLT
jgi:hypothetical protein